MGSACGFCGAHCATLELKGLAGKMFWSATVLFNSYSFVFVFLPVVLFVFWLLRKLETAPFFWLVAASLFFYGWWSASALPILMGSVFWNYAAGRAVNALSNREIRKVAAGVAIVGDLVLLGYFKYFGFFTDNLCAVFSVACRHASVLLPIGISFFTFTQIAYVVDVYRKQVVDTNFLRYVLFVTYFPHLIAGPILHHAEMMPQFRLTHRTNVLPNNVAVGLTVFVIGLFKKVCLADSISVLVPPVFDSLTFNYSPGDAWVATISYALQIYFDFSAYSDMALGASFMFGVKLPINFNSPYKAVSIIEFWRRWHISLSRFLRDYLYIPLGGNRLGPKRRYINLMITMALGGFWHGAAWTFLIWGGLHGAYLMVNHGWRSLVRRGIVSNVPDPLSWALTMFAVIIAWTFFRAPTTQAAMTILGSMVGILDGPPSGLVTVGSVALITVLTGIALFCPNLQQIMPRQYYLGDVERSSLQWSPTLPWACGIAVVAVFSIVFISRQSVFLYFQF